MFFVLPPIHANAECKLKNTYPPIELNKVGAPATYADGEKLTGTVSAATGFNCEGFRVEFRACPSESTGAKCDITNGALVLANPGPAIASGKATISWNVKKLRADVDKYVLRAVVGTGVGGQSSQVFSSEIVIRAAGLCTMTNFTALKKGQVLDLKISSNASCEGKTTTIQLWTQDAKGNQAPGPIVATGKILNNQSTATWTIDSPTVSFFLRGMVAGGGDYKDVMFLNGEPTPPPGGTKYSCNASNQCVVNTSGTYTTSNCDNKCVGATASKSYVFNITNPLKGGPNDLFDIINIVTKWIIYISVPLAVLWIMYAGFLMLTAGPTPANFQKGRDILKYVVIGLAIIFIGKGFVTLIISIIQLGGTS